MVSKGEMPGDGLRLRVERKIRLPVKGDWFLIMLINL